MKHDGLISISELAKYARISRTALIHYDHIGLIRPEARGENNYRYYSHRQITVANLVMTLQELGMPLKEIARLVESRTPEATVGIFARQSEHLDREIGRLQKSRQLLDTLCSIIESGLSADEDVVEARFEQAESILLGPRIDYSGGKSIKEATLDFYKQCSLADPDIDLNYPVWGMFDESRVKNRDWRGPDRFYFRMPDAPDLKPSGLYAVGYDRGYYGESDGLYKKLTAFIGGNGLEICGPAYEEYPLNEISVSDDNNYLMKISISVKPRTDPKN
jgi:DNA-binding transcriptional MerR regulator